MKGEFNEREIDVLKLLASIIPKPEQREIVTLRVFVREYLEFIKENRSDEYYKSVRTTTEKLCEYFGIHTPISSITLHEAEMYVSKMKQSAPRGYRVYYRNLKAAFNKAIDWGYISRNPFAKIKLNKTQRNKPIFLTRNELDKIIKEINSQDVKDAVMISFLAGLRLGEVVSLRWSNIDFGRKLIVVGDENFTTKGKEQRFVPMNEEVVRIMTKRFEESEKGNISLRIININSGENEKLREFVISKRNGASYHKDYISKKFKEGCRAAGVDERIHFHTLRHSFASNLAQKGISIYTIKELLGHSSINTTMIYAHLRIDVMREAVERL